MAKRKKQKRASGRAKSTGRRKHIHTPTHLGEAKRKLAAHEEFEIMKLVLDKFLWLGTVLLGVGLYFSITSDAQTGMWYILSGALVMIVFAWFIVKEFERIR
ncbi:hypothetical protein D6825_01340 [Candidatus Woesearchaeota archaeon]|nr:MAG: hypothetical protein D6825_01340 [Candidatus Woesearchaeota archaeon]